MDKNIVILVGVFVGLICAGQALAQKKGEVEVFSRGNQYLSFQDYRIQQIKNEITQFRVDLSDEQFNLYIDGLIKSISKEGLDLEKENRLLDYIKQSRKEKSISTEKEVLTDPLVEMKDMLIEYQNKHNIKNQITLDTSKIRTLELPGKPSK